MSNINRIKFQLNEISNIAESLWQTLKEYRIIAIDGQMGAGKTTFSGALAKVAGITQQLSSPTFSIMNEYELKNDVYEALVHMDWYRLDDVESLIDAGVENELNDLSKRCWIEWYQKAPELLRKPYAIIHLQLGELPDERTIEIEIKK